MYIFIEVEIKNTIGLFRLTQLFVIKNLSHVLPLSINGRQVHLFSTPHFPSSPIKLGIVGFGTRETAPNAVQLLSSASALSITEVAYNILYNNTIDNFPCERLT